MRAISILTTFLSLTLSINFSFSQQNLSEVFDKWKEGEYKYFRNWGDKELNMVEETMHKAKVKFSKNSKNGASQISFTGTNDNGYYDHVHQGETDFVRYYSDGYNKRLHLTGNTIIIYNITETFDKIEIEILGCIGKKIGQKDVNNLKSHLEATKKYWIPRTFIEAKDQIVSVKATPVYPAGQTAVEINKPFFLGIEVEYSWGMKSKTRNLGGSVKSNNYSVLCNDVSYKKKDEYLDEIIILTPDCRFIKNNVIKFKGSAGGKEFTLDIPCNCDADNSPSLVYARKWSAYDEITIAQKNGENFENKTFKNDYGFLHCSNELHSVLNANEKNKNYLVRVVKGGKYGWADLDAKLVIPCEYEGGSVGIMADNIIGVKKNGKWGYIDFQNKIVAPIKYDMVGNFKKGFGYIELNKKQGYVNAKGVEVVKPEYDKVWGFNYGAVVVQKGDKYGFVRDNGTIIGSINYDDAFDFNSFKYGAVKNNGKYGILDLSGNIVLPIEQPSLPVTLGADVFKIKKDGNFGAINKSGKLVAKFEYDEIYPTGNVWQKDAKSRESESVFRVKKNYYYGYIKSDGTVISDCIFSEADDFSDGYAWVQLRDYDNRLTKKGRYNLAERQVNWFEEIPDPVEEVTTTNSSSKKSTTKSSPKSDKKTIKNTGRGILHMGADGSTGFNLNSGSSREFPCRQKIYYTYYENNGYNGKGPVISAAGEDCGATINANGDQYNKK